MHRPARAVAAVVAVVLVITGFGGFLSAAQAAVQRAAPVNTITTVAPSPYLATSTTLTVTGTTSATNDTVAVKLTPATIAPSVNATVNADKTWSATFTASQVSQISDGTVTVTATGTNTGLSGTPVTKTFTKDTVAPAVSGQAVTPSVMGGSNLVATVSGTVKASTSGLAAGESGDVVTISADDTDPATATVTATVTSGSSGTFSTTVNTATLTDGTITYTIVARDPAGNASASVTTTNTKKATAPNAPTVQVTPSPINNAGKSSVTVAGAASGGTSSVSISITDGVHAPVTTTSAVTSNAYSKTGVDVSGLNDGNLTVTVTATDTAGNVSTATTITVVKDTVAPASTLVVPAYVTASTAAATPVSGASEAGATIVVKAVAAGTTTPSATVTVTVPAGGSWSATLDTSGLADGNITVTATPTDAAANSGTVVSKTSVKDTVAPAAPATVTASPTSYSSGTFTVSGTTTLAEGTATQTVDVTVTDSAGTSLTATNQTVTPGSTGAAGTFSVAFTAAQMSTLAEGTLTISAVFRDPAGNASPATTTTARNGVLKLVSTNPVDATTSSSPATISATYNQTLSSSGTSTTSTIGVKTTTGTTIAGSTSVSGTTITFTPFNILPDGSYTATATVYDQGSPAQTLTTTFGFTVKATAPPAAPAITSIPDPITTVNQKTVVVSGTADQAGKPVTVNLADLTKTVNAGSDKKWTMTFDATAVPDGTVVVEATQSDGSRTSATTVVTVEKDTRAPVLVSSTPANGSTVTSVTSVVANYDQSLASTGTITITGVTGTTAVSGRRITFTASAQLRSGTYTATVRITDLVGNPTTSTITFTVPPPTASSVTLDALPAAIVSGASITIKGAVTQTTKAAYGAVTLKAVTGSGQVVDLGALSLTSSGTFTKTIKPTVNATYQVTYAGDGANASSTSPQRGTDVAPKVSATTTRGKATVQATISGGAAPAVAGTVVTVYKIVSGSAVKLGTTQLDAKGKYAFKVKLPKGNTDVVVVVSATANNSAGSARVTAVRT